MLERHIHIPTNFVAGGDRRDEFIRPMRRMRIKQPEPKIAWNCLRATEQLTEQFLPPSQIPAVKSRILRNEINFPAVRSDQGPDFRQDIVHRPTPIPAPNPRDAAKRTGMVTAFGNFHIRSMLGRQPEPWGGKIGNVLRRS